MLCSKRLCRETVWAIAAIGLGLVLATPGVAQGRRGGGARHAAAIPKPPKSVKTPAVNNTPIDEFVRMSPEERQKALSQLPPDRAEKLQKQLTDYNKLTPEQQATAREQLEIFRSLPPERQEALRKAFHKFSQAPPDRQQAMRQELNQLRGMSAAERQERLNSRDFKSRFNGGEQKTLGEMSNLPSDR